jgi:ABC-type bacteriocin/lantibiotic exporter with double-glycine peptidase domain
VRIVLSGFEQTLEESRIRQLLGNPRFGLTLSQAKKKLLEIGAVAEWHDDWSLDDLRDALREGNFPIVGVERRFFGHQSAAHAVVITNVQSAKIEFLDPLADKPQKTQPETFTTAWETTGREVLILLSSIPENLE